MQERKKTKSKEIIQRLNELSSVGKRMMTFRSDVPQSRYDTALLRHNVCNQQWCCTAVAGLAIFAAGQRHHIFQVCSPSGGVHGSESERCVVLWEWAVRCIMGNDSLTHYSLRARSGYQQQQQIQSTDLRLMSKFVMWTLLEMMLGSNCNHSTYLNFAIWFSFPLSQPMSECFSDDVDLLYLTFPLGKCSSHFSPKIAIKWLQLFHRGNVQVILVP